MTMPTAYDLSATPESRTGGGLVWLRYWADLLDSRFRIPGTEVRFGIDPILSFIPGLGDLASPIFTVVLLAQGLRQHVPKVVMVHMVGNAVLDALIGMVPVAGNIGDIFWRANNLNLALLERHAQPGRQPSAGDYAFVWLITIALGLMVIIPVLIGLWFTIMLWQLMTAR